MIEEQESIPLLRLLEDILYNRIKQKKQEMHRTHNRADTDRVWTEIETLQWVLSQSLISEDRLSIMRGDTTTMSGEKEEGDRDLESDM
jgi:hypothetical protein